MLTILIILSLASFSFQIENCIETEKVCKTCKDGYTLVKGKYMQKCMKNELVGNENDGCAYYYDTSKSSCQECKRGYARDLKTDNCLKSVDYCEEIDNNECTRCEQYYKLSDGICEKTSCSYFDEEGQCDCQNGFYVVDNESCKKLPFKNCKKGNANICTTCYKGFKLENNQCNFIGYDDEEDDDKDKGEEDEMTIPHCSYPDYNDITKCGECEQNYDLNADSTQCNYVCIEIEEICSDCKDNYFLSSSGNCEIIDPDYVESESNAKFESIKFSSFILLISLMILFY